MQEGKAALRHRPRARRSVEPTKEPTRSRLFGRFINETDGSMIFTPRVMRTALVDWKEAQQKAAQMERWAVIMTKVRIRRVASRTGWQLVTFYGIC